MRVCLVNPPFLFPHERNIALSHCLGIRSLSSYLREQGNHKVRVLDALFLGIDRVAKYDSGVLVGLSHDEIVRRIPRDTEMIGVGAPFSQLAPVVHDLVARIKDRFPGVPVVMGGAYPSTQPALALTSAADMIVVGEGERAIAALAEGADPAGVVGVYSHASSVDGRPAFAPVVEDMDDLPFPDYSLDLIEQYFSVSPRRWRNQRVASLATSRSCPYNCEFCSIHSVFGWGFRGRSAGLVLEEVEFVARRFGVRLIEFEDDNLTFDRERAATIFEGFVHLRERGLAMEWRTPNGVRIDTLDDELVGLIKRSGCIELTLGLEHGDPEMLAIMDKRLDLDRAYHVLTLCRKHDIPKVVVFYIVGYPGETPERFATGMKYLERIKQLGPSMCVSTSLVQPYPGTRLLKRCRVEGYIHDPDYDNFLVRRDFMDTGYTVSIEGPDLDRQEVLRRRYQVDRLFDPTQGSLAARIMSGGRRRVRRTLRLATKAPDRLGRRS